MGSISSANSYLQPLITLQNTGLTNIEFRSRGRKFAWAENR